MLFVSAVKVHGIVVADDVVVDFLTNERADVPEDELFNLIRQFSKCACFFIELSISGEAHKTITAEVRMT